MPVAPQLDGGFTPIRPVQGGQINVQADSNAFGASLGKGIQSASQDVFNVFARFHEQANQAAVNDGIAQATRRANELQLAHRQQYGQDAIKSAPDVQAKYGQTLDDIAGQTLSNDAQRRAFQAWRGQAQASFDNAINTHAAQQGEVQYNADHQARKDGQIAQASLNYKNPDMVAASWKDIGAANDAYAQHMGMTPIQKEAMNRMDADRMAGALVQSSLTDKDWVTAQQVVQQFGPMMSPDGRAKLVQATQAAELDGRAKAITSNVVSRVNPDGSQLDEEHALAEADKQVNEATKGWAPSRADDLRDTVRAKTAQTIRQQFAAHTESQNLTEMKIIEAAIKDPAGIAADGVAPLLAQLDPLRAKKVQDEWNKAAAPDPIQSRLALANYELSLGNPDQAKVRQVVDAGPQAALAGLTKEDQKSAIDAWKTAYLANQDPLAKQKLDGIVSKSQAVEGVLTAAGMSYQKDNTGKVREDTAAALDWINREGLAMQQARPDKRPLTPSDWELLARRAVAKQVIEKGWIWDTTKKTYEIQQESIKNIPPEDRSKLEDGFTMKYGRPPTAAELATMFQVYQKNTPAKKP